MSPVERQHNHGFFPGAAPTRGGAEPHLKRKKKRKICATVNRGGNPRRALNQASSLPPSHPDTKQNSVKYPIMIHDFP